MPVVCVEKDEKAQVGMGGTQLLGPVPPWCPHLNGPYGDKVRHSLPGTRYIPEKNESQLPAESCWFRFGILATTDQLAMGEKCLPFKVPFVAPKRINALRKGAQRVHPAPSVPSWGKVISVGRKP